jgi:hypothetical protein
MTSSEIVGLAPVRFVEARPGAQNLTCPTRAAPFYCHLAALCLFPVISSLAISGRVGREPGWARVSACWLLLCLVALWYTGTNRYQWSEALVSCPYFPLLPRWSLGLCLLSRWLSLFTPGPDALPVIYFCCLTYFLVNPRSLCSSFAVCALWAVCSIWWVLIVCVLDSCYGLLVWVGIWRCCCLVLACCARLSLWYWLARSGSHLCVWLVPWCLILILKPLVALKC